VFAPTRRALFKRGDLPRKRERSLGSRTQRLQQNSSRFRGFSSFTLLSREAAGISPAASFLLEDHHNAAPQYRHRR